ncbi:hypothetical protein QD336_23515 [Rhizobium sp. BR 250]
MFEAAIARTRDHLFLTCSNQDKCFDGFARMLGNLEPQPALINFSGVHIPTCRL